MALIGVEVVTPEKNLFTCAAVSVVTKTSEGDLTVMSEHAELIGDVVPGITKLELASGEIMDVVVHGGFLQVHTQEGAADDLFGDGEAAPARSTRVTLLAGVAELTTDIDLAQVEVDIAEAEVSVDKFTALVSGKGPDDPTLKESEFELEQAHTALDRARLRKLAVSTKSAS
jgi:F-type H+-transporting ATPase subunit epsilon